MYASSRHALRAFVPVVALIGASAGLVASSATAATPPSPIRMVVGSPTQTVERWENEPVYLYDLGIYEVADKTFELRANRPKYSQPVVASYSVGDGASKVTTALPSGLMTAADHISDFYTTTIKNSAGAVVSQSATDFCPNSYTAARATPTGAPTSPYPQQCGNHPFALGGVFGIARGWSVKALDDYYGGTTFDGPDGTYSVTMTITPAWRKALGIKAAEATGTVSLQVTTVQDPFGGGAAVAAHTATQHAALAGEHQHSAAAAAGVLSPQGVKLEAGRLRALGIAATPAARPSSVRSLSTTATAAVQGPRPDLRSLPAYQIQLDTNDINGNPSDRTYLDFGATVWNAGPSPLVVDGFRRPGTDLMDAYQYFYDAKGNEVGSAPAGTLEWDPRAGHQHWHFTAFATYQLLNADQSLVVRSGKEAFCLAPTDAVNLNLPGANWKPYSTGLGTACGSQGALSIREVLDAGWGDTYGQYLPGQSFDITDVANGIYFIQVLANPDNKLSESSSTNNSALRKIKIGGTKGGTRTLYVYPYQGIAAP